MVAQLVLKILFLCSSICFKEIQCGDVASFTITTAGVDITNEATFELYWNDTIHACKFNGSSTNPYLCNVSASTTNTNINPAAAAPFFMKVKYNSSNTSFPIESIIINTVNDESYSINVFCIPPGMNYTMSRLANTSWTRQACVHWYSKIKYNQIAIGGPKFELLYIYFRNNIQHYGNSNLPFEGSVAPPALKSIGFQTGNPGTGVSTAPFIINAVQWDQTFYQCNELSGTNGDENYTCTPNSLLCPGAVSNFWFSIHCANSVAFKCSISKIIVKDETGRQYYANDFCVNQYSYVPETSGDCTHSAGATAQELELSNNVMFPQLWSAIVGNYHATIFDYPDNQSSPMASTFDISFPGGFGLDVPLDCPVTSAPSQAPSQAPSSSPVSTPSTQAPTQAPSQAPSQAPTLSPTWSPTSPICTGCTRINIENPDLWQGDIGYLQDELVVSFFGQAYWINNSLMADTKNGVIGTLSESDSHPRFTEIFMVTNERGLSVSVEVSKIGRISVKSWSLPIAFFSNVGNANGDANWHYVEQLSFKNTSWKDAFRIHSGDGKHYNLHALNIQDLMRISLDGITYIRKGAGNATAPPTSTPWPIFEKTLQPKQNVSSSSTTPSTTDDCHILSFINGALVLGCIVTFGVIFTCHERKIRQMNRKIQQIQQMQRDKNTKDNDKKVEMTQINR